MRLIRSLLSRIDAQTTPRGRGVAILLTVVVLLAVATGEVVLYRVSYFLVLGLVVSYAWIRLSLRRLDMWVEGQSSVAQGGDMLEGSIHVCNNSPLPTGWLEIVQMSDMDGPACGGATQLSPRWYEVWEVQRYCCARGVYTMGPLVARSSDPLALFRLQITRGDRATVVVYPPTVPLPYFRLPASDLSCEGGMWRRMQTRSAHVDTVREYAAGDSMNRIHWPSTARCDRLMSKEFESGSSSDVWIVLDLEREIHRSKGIERTDEYAVAGAASLAYLALAEERSVGLIAYGDREFYLPLGSGPRQMSRVMETLAWSRTEGHTPLAEVLSQNASRFSRFASLLIVTCSPATEWVPVLESLTGRALRVVVVMVDPGSFGGAESCGDALTMLLSAGISVYVVRSGDALSVALSQPTTPHDVSVSAENCGAETSSIS